MTEDDQGIDSMIEEAKKRAKEREVLEKRNRKRRVKGLPPLPDEQDMLDTKARKVRHRTGDVVAVDGASALKLFEARRAAMMSGSDTEDDGDGVEEVQHTPDKGVDAEGQAQRDAAAARRVSDMKNGRIDHNGVWEDGQKLEGGDDTILPAMPSAKSGKSDVVKSSEAWDEASAKTPQRSDGASDKTDIVISRDEFDYFRRDLYFRLKESFAGLEQTLSDLQGRVSEMPSGSHPPSEDEHDTGGDSFKKLLERSVPVVFDVEGTKMSFSAITVFHASPCITVVTKIGSAAITPKPGARLRLSYEMDGVKYDKDPVTYLGTRFELPMFGLAFVGFIRDLEADRLDVDSESSDEPS